MLTTPDDSGIISQSLIEMLRHIFPLWFAFRLHADCTPVQVKLIYLVQVHFLDLGQVGQNSFIKTTFLGGVHSDSDFTASLQAFK